MISLLIIISFPGILIAFIALLVPNVLFKLYILWYIMFALLFYAYTIQLQDFPSDGMFGGLHDQVFWSNITFSILGIFLRYTFISTSLKKENNIVGEILDDKVNNSLNLIGYLTSVAYGLIAAYYLYLYFGDILSGYSIAWISYLIAFSFILSLVYISSFSGLVKELNKLKVYKRYLQFFSYSLCGVILALLIYSIDVPSLIIEKTYLTLQQESLTSLSQQENLKYCIQLRNSLIARERYRAVNALLDLSPLIMYSQEDPGSDFGWGNPFFHAILVVENKKQTNLYNWSYKQKKWDYLKVGFAKRASIDELEIVCSPQHNYFSQIPWIFPKKVKSLK